MRHLIWSVLMITVGIFIAGEWDTHNRLVANTSLTDDLVETGQPHVVLAKSGTRQQKEARQNEGCPVIPNRDFSQHKTNEQDSSIMKGLVF